MIKSKSRNVNGYVKAKLKHAALKAKYEAKLAALEPLKLKMDQAEGDVFTRHRKLTGGQIGEALRIIAAEQAVAS